MLFIAIARTPRGDARNKGTVISRETLCRLFILFWMDFSKKTGRSTAHVANQLLHLLKKLHGGGTERAQSVRRILHKLGCDIGDEVRTLPLSDTEQGEVKSGLASCQHPIYFEIWQTEGKMFLVKFDRTAAVDVSKPMTCVDLSIFSKADKGAKRKIASEIVKLKFDRLSEGALDDWLGIHIVSTANGKSLSLGYQPEFAIAVIYCWQNGLSLEDISRFVAYARLQSKGLDSLGMALMVIRDSLVWREVTSDKPYDIDDKLKLAGDDAIALEEIMRRIKEANALLGAADNDKEISDAAKTACRAFIAILGYNNLYPSAPLSTDNIHFKDPSSQHYPFVIRLQKALMRKILEEGPDLAAVYVQHYRDLVLSNKFVGVPQEFTDRATKKLDQFVQLM